MILRNIFLKLLLLCIFTNTEIYGDPGALDSILDGLKHEIKKENISLSQASNLPCSRLNGVKGNCLPHYLCDDSDLLTGIVKKTITILVPETAEDFQNSTCPHYLESCCPPNQIKSLENRLEPSVVPQCGWSSPGGLSGPDESVRFAGSLDISQFAEYPWMIGLIRRKNEAWENTFYGGGALIHPAVVLTAAHKVHMRKESRDLEPYQIKCRAGEWDTFTKIERYPYQDRNLKKIIKHENYEKYSHVNNIALLILEAPFVMDPNIGIACLSREPFSPGTLCSGMGWGTDKTKQHITNVLKKANLTLISKPVCEKNLGMVKGEFILHETLTCATRVGTGYLCKYDGGSPLVCTVEGEIDRFSVYGLVAYGVGCANDNPEVFVKISSLIGWIDSQMIKEGFGTEGYTVNNKDE